MNKHPFDPISFLFGATFAIVGLIFLIGDVDIIDLGWHWLWPAPLIFLGALILLLSLRSFRRETGPSQEEPAEL
ncbi:MAG: hypothetical protein QOK47_907 [Actinomycetota bacterium]|nr:hypothetical protein [Actinomycetota bacterium]